MKIEGLKEFLDEKVDKYNRPEFIESDPIQIPRQYNQKEDIEIAAFLTATISWGSRPAIIKNALRLLSLMQNRPFEFITEGSFSDFEKLSTFVHRTFNGQDCIYFMHALKNIYQNHVGLQTVFEIGYKKEGNIKSALKYFHNVFFEIPGERTRKHVANVEKGASGKRLNMCMRWLIRKDKNGVDFGIWDGIPASALMLPLDVHTGNVARKLGLLNRKQDNWKAVEEVTAELRKFDSEDPVKYDFALFGLGVFEKF